MKKFNFFFWGNFIASWIGAKFFYLLLDNNYTSLVLNSNFWLGGGFVFYGGLVFCLIYTYGFLKLSNQPWRSLDFILPIIPLAHAIGRVGCFLAGCCYGIKTNFFISFHMHDYQRHPVQIYEALFLFLLSYTLYKKRSLLLYLISYSSFRFLIEFLRGDKIRGEFFLFSTSQWVSLVIVCVFLGYQIKKKLINNSSRR